VDEISLTPAGAARLLGISEDEAGELARPDGRVLPDAVRERLDSTVLELARELARAREELGRLSGQLKEVRATNLRLQKEAKESTEERLMLMERIEHLARIEQTLAESEAELERLRSRGFLDRVLNRD